MTLPLPHNRRVTSRSVCRSSATTAGGDPLRPVLRRPPVFAAARTVTSPVLRLSRHRHRVHPLRHRRPTGEPNDPVLHTRRGDRGSNRRRPPRGNRHNQSRNSHVTRSGQAGAMPGRTRPCHRRPRRNALGTVTHRGRSRNTTVSAAGRRRSRVEVKFPSITHAGCSINSRTRCRQSGTGLGRHPGHQ